VYCWVLPAHTLRDRKEATVSEQDKQELLDAAKRAMEKLDALSKEEKIARLKQVGILSEDGQLSERYGGPGRAQTDAPDAVGAG
jgi:hypothetical protein